MKHILIKLNFYFRKAKEIFNRSNAAGFSIQLSDYAKIVLSLDISAQLLGITFNHNDKFKLASLKRSVYNNNKKIIEKVLNLNKRLDISGIILKLSITNTAIEHTANNIFDTYKSDFSFKNQIDFDHPQYVTMSVYQSCKKHKLKLPKTKFVAISNLKPAQFNQCEKDWDEWLLTTIIGKPVGKENMKGNSTETSQINSKFTQCKENK